MAGPGCGARLLGCRTGVPAGLFPYLRQQFGGRNVDPEVDAAGQEARATEPL